MSKDTSTSEAAEERTVFSAWLEGHARGTLNADATAALGEVVKAVGDLGKAGKVTIELTIEPAGSGGRTVTIGGRVSGKPPRPAPEVGIFYIGDGGSLHRDDPYAVRMPGVPYVDTAGDARLIDPDTGDVRRFEPAPLPTPTTDPEDD